MRILVTGGMGFIGSNFIDYLLHQTSDIFIVNYDKLTYAGNPENLSNLTQNVKKYTFVKGDICDFNLVSTLLDKYQIDIIVNFAAESHVDRSILDPNIFVETNVKGTLTLLNAAKSHKIKKFIQISTDEVYGSLSFTDKPFTELNPLQPSSPYSASKTAADLLALSYYKTFNLPVSITRCSNNYGPYQFPEKLIPLMINNILHDKPLPVYGDGKNIRDWIYVEDHCTGILKVIEQGKEGEVYNLGGNSEISNITIVDTLLSKLNKGKELIQFVKDRPGHDLRYAMDFSKAKRELKWAPKYTFNKGIDKTIQWYLDNQTWLQHVVSGEYKDYYEKMYSKKSN